jgi:acyl-CoA hydrolase
MAVIIRVYSEVSGSIAYASSVNKVVDDLYTLQNGNINSANIIGSGVGAANLETSSVISRAINDSAVTFVKCDYELVLAKEVFP